jgi:hypothetical protein
MDVTTKTITLDRGSKIDKKLWQMYVDIDYGKLMPSKLYKGYKTYIADITGADVTGSKKEGFELTFNTQKSYTWFLLKYS